MLCFLLFLKIDRNLSFEGVVTLAEGNTGLGSFIIKRVKRFDCQDVHSQRNVKNINILGI